jgi:tRNA dimethylallyltransferase
VDTSFAFHVVVLMRPREELYTRIERRVEEMLAGGLLEENRRLLEAGYRLEAPPLRTIGYQEPLTYLRGEVGYEEMVRLMKRNSRRYAKRQLTWYRRHPSYEWVDLSTSPAPAVEEHLITLARGL